ncbi:hypothetical protein TNCV_1668541 [Trichonephila clavipes]|nr:hypothetical protein TNCV_1668541 [Trichonephila clavipes]
MSSIVCEAFQCIESFWGSLFDVYLTMEYVKPTKMTLEAESFLIGRGRDYYLGYWSKSPLTRWTLKPEIDFFVSWIKEDQRLTDLRT